MTVINTNVGALTARTYALNANDGMQTAMERLSSGLRINSAADDAAGLAVANKMESQLRGINVAIRNSQDGISLVQTAEAGMSEITNMIIRMRELSVQMNNGVYTDGDRSNAQLEVSALLKEINKIADNTAFNNVKVLDGTYSTTIRAGNTNVETIDLTISSQRATVLGGVDATSALATSTATGTRTTASQVTTSTVSAKEATEVRVAFSDDMQTFATTATAASKTLTYALSGTDNAEFALDTANNLIKDTAAFTSGDSKAVTVTVTARAATSTASEDSSVATGNSIASSFTVEESDAVTIARSSELANYVTNNPLSHTAEYVITGGTNSADFSINSSNGVLSGASATSLDASTATRNVVVTLYDRKTTETAVNTSEVSTNSTNGSSTTTINTAFEEAGTVTIAKTNALTALIADDGTSNNATNNQANNIDVAVAHTGGANVGAANAFAFSGGNIVGTGINYASSATYTITATATLKATTGDITANGDGGYTNNANTTGTLAVSMDNAASMTIGVDATATNGTKDAIAANGASVVITSAVNSAGTDVSGSLQINNTTGVITLASGASPLAAETYTIVRTVSHDGDSDGTVNTHTETITLTVTDWKHIDTYTVTPTESSVVATDNLTVNSTASDTFVDNISLSVTGNKDYLGDIDLSTIAGAERAVTILDKALDEISSSQAKLGAIQNRLQHNIDNLTTGSMLTQTARGRIVDADFARETSELSKQQILGQAATSMLAQANQSKQSILALLQ